MKADEVQSAVLDSTDNVFSAYCKQMWMTPNREDIKTNLKLLFKVCQKSMSISLNNIACLRHISRNMENEWSRINSLPSCSLKSKNCQTSLMSLMSLLFSSKIWIQGLPHNQRTSRHSSRSSRRSVTRVLESSDVHRWRPPMHRSLSRDLPWKTRWNCSMCIYRGFWRKIFMILQVQSIRLLARIRTLEQIQMQIVNYLLQNGEIWL